MSFDSVSIESSIISSYRPRVIFVSDIVYTSCNLNLMQDCFRIILILSNKASRVIVKRYQLSFQLFCIFSIINAQGVHLCSKPD